MESCKSGEKKASYHFSSNEYHEGGHEKLVRALLDEFLSKVHIYSPVRLGDGSGYEGDIYF
ncbi:hypothetical protein H6G33_09780 [Calothrix sp. FACHB-1219]|uniref:hypothetical protein n=1 Tax=unclassified Calothrix TaxID=2619626 RepID=UPI0016887C8E|nr:MULTISPECIES: hypothetical protein [unclassified Calothrix]MBD2201635.1 hypothetical protein [Calothrix sp. FACHB-168]MBD2217321.1 hypothetical protein [Calothrix sp. FACHB-1219]